MTIDEAIENLYNLLQTSSREKSPEFWDSVQLGFKALKRERECRENAPREEWLLLPGETES